MNPARLLPFLLLLALPFLAQCASTSKASEERDAAAKSFEVPADRGVVYLYRTGRMVGAAIQIPVRINGVDAGGTGPGTYFRWELKPGIYTFSSSTDEASATVEVQVEAGRMAFVEQNARLGLSDMRLSMKLVDEAQGMKVVKGSKLLVSAYVTGE